MFVINRVKAVVLVFYVDHSVATVPSGNCCSCFHERHSLRSLAATDLEPMVYSVGSELVS